ncbi:Acid phosphatase 1 [Linum grandiflorum]
MDYATDIIINNATEYDGMDAWVLDVDDTCVSNALYYKLKRSYGCLPFDPLSFRAWAYRAHCPAIPAVLGLFENLRAMGFKVFLVSGRDEEGLGAATRLNLVHQGFVGYERLILRTASYRGQSAVVYKSEMRRQLMEEGYRIWGNVGDQWSDLTGHSLGNRTFKLPNPMYFVP